MAINYETLMGNKPGANANTKASVDLEQKEEESTIKSKSAIPITKPVTNTAESDSTADKPVRLISRRQQEQLERQKEVTQRQNRSDLGSARVTPKVSDVSNTLNSPDNDATLASKDVFVSESSSSDNDLMGPKSSDITSDYEDSDDIKSEPEHGDFTSDIESIVLNVLERNLESSVGNAISDVMANSVDMSLLASKNMPFVSSGGAVLKDKNGRDKYDKEYSGKLTQVKLPSHIVQSIKAVVPPGATNNDAVSAYVAAMIKDPTGLSEKGRVIYDDLRAVDSLEMLTKEIEREHKVLENALKDVRAKENMVMTMLADLMLSSNGFARQSYPTQVSHLTFDSSRVDRVADMLRVVHKDTQNGLAKNVINDYTNITPRSGL